MNDRDCLNCIYRTLHSFMGMKAHLVLEDNYVDPKDDLDDAMNLIADLAKDIEAYLKEG